MNVLHILSDQHQAACMGCEGHAQALTPNMDRLASEGMRFSAAYTQNPICTPSRMSMYTGQYCHNHGFFGLGGPRPEGMQSFLGHFKQHGYKTAVIGKTHVPNQPRDWLLEHVDYWMSGTSTPVPATGGLSPYQTFLAGAGLLEQNDNFRITGYPARHPVGLPQNQFRARPSELPLEYNVESWCVDRAIEFMDGCEGDPFCMQVSLPRPHAPYTPDQKFWDLYADDIALPETYYQDPSGRPPHFRDMHARFQRAWEREEWSPEEGARNIWRGYLGCVTQVDYCIGRLLDYLDERGLAKDTIVVYNSDHGAYSTAFGIQEKAPGICSEAVCRVPMLWRVPGVAVEGKVCDALVENVDLAPTFMNLCGLPAMEGMDGVDISELLRGGTDPVREVAVTEHRHSKALRWGTWRYVYYQPEDFGTDCGELYDLEADPHEARNLYGEPAFQEIVEQGEKLLCHWLISTRQYRTAFSVGAWNETNYV